MMAQYYAVLQRRSLGHHPRQEAPQLLTCTLQTWPTYTMHIFEHPDSSVSNSGWSDVISRRTLHLCPQWKQFPCHWNTNMSFTSLLTCSHIQIFWARQTILQTFFFSNTNRHWWPLENETKLGISDIYPRFLCEIWDKLENFKTE